MLRLIADLRQFVAAVLGTGDPTRTGEALHAILHAQQSLFQLPPGRFLGLSLEMQIDLLAHAEAPADAIEKVTAYAETLTEAARIYAATNRAELAMASRQLAQEALRIAAVRWPAGLAARAPG